MTPASLEALSVQVSATLLVAAVVPLAVGLYLHGHMNLGAVLKNAFG